MGLELKADTGPGQLVKPVGRQPRKATLGTVPCQRAAQGPSTRPTPSSPRKPGPKAAHLAVAQGQGPGPPPCPRPLLKGSTVRLGLPDPSPSSQDSTIQRDSIIKSTILCSSGCPWRQAPQCRKPPGFLTRRVSTATHPCQQTV